MTDDLKLVEQLRKRADVLSAIDDVPTLAASGPLRSAADAIERLMRERDEAVGSAERQWTGWVKCDVARRGAEADRDRLAAQVAEMREALGAYDAALANREHGGIAAHRFVDAARALLQRTQEQKP